MYKVQVTWTLYKAMTVPILTFHKLSDRFVQSPVMLLDSTTILSLRKNEKIAIHK